MKRGFRGFSVCKKGALFSDNFILTDKIQKDSWYNGMDCTKVRVIQLVHLRNRMRKLT